MMDQRICDYFGRRAKYADTRVGIELEYEGWNDERLYPELDYWACTQDTSLRNGGIELVSNPLPLDMLDGAFDEVREFHTEYPDLDASERCGLHVHLNVGYWTWKQLFSFSAGWVLVEPTMFQRFAKGRDESHFCVPSYLNTALTRDIVRAHKQLSRNVEMLPAHLGGPGMPMLNCPKYCAVNYAPLARLQTIEFRHPPSTKSMEQVREWVEAILAVQFHTCDKDANRIVDDYEAGGLNSLLDTLGIEPAEIDDLDQEDAEDTANYYCGVPPIDWRTLDWQFKEAV